MHRLFTPRPHQNTLLTHPLLLALDKNSIFREFCPAQKLGMTGLRVTTPLIRSQLRMAMWPISRQWDRQKYYWRDQRKSSSFSSVKWLPDIYWAHYMPLLYHIFLYETWKRNNFTFVVPGKQLKDKPT